MPRKMGPLDFKQSNVTRALNAARAAGMKARLEIDIPRQTITIIPDEEGGDAATDTPESIIEQL